MKFHIDKKTLLSAVRNLNSVVERRNTIAILGNIKIEVMGDDLNLFATDTDIEIMQNLRIDGKQNGATTVCAQTLSDIVSKLKDGNISLEQKEHVVIVKSGRSRFKLPCIHHGDFPDMSTHDYDVTFNIASHDLARLIDNVKFCASTEETRYYLNGVYVHIEGDKLRGVATDGHRLALCDIDKPEGAGDFAGIIIPNKALVVIRKLIEGEGSNVDLSISENKIRVKTSDCSLTSKLIDGTFPDYKRVIPQSNENIIVYDADVLLGVIDRVSTVSDAKTNSVKLAVSSDGIVISAGGSDGSSATEDIECDNQFGLEIGFNSKLLIDALSHINSGECVIKLDQSSSPAIITRAKDDGCLFVVMPMRV